jgi:hypothetical protein
MSNRQDITINNKNTTAKLLETNVAIWFNKTCELHHLTPKYVNVKINDNIQQNSNTKISVTVVPPQTLFLYYLHSSRFARSKKYGKYRVRDSESFEEDH